jgi:hypothetical protein
MRIISSMGFDPYKDDRDEKFHERVEELNKTQQFYKNCQNMFAENPHKRVFANIKGHEARRLKKGEKPKITLPKLKFMEGEDD